MKAWRVMSVAAGVAMLTGTAATAQTPSDVRCLMASNLFSKAAKDPNARKLAEAGKYFYLGRVAGRLNEQQLRTQMVSQTKTLTPTNAAAVMKACASQMESGAEMVERVGKQLKPQKN